MSSTSFRNPLLDPEDELFCDKLSSVGGLLRYGRMTSEVSSTIVEA
jgi:hypothetical protein